MVFFSVSVPYRGATFLNQQNVFNEKHLSVSVPYRGATFLNDTENCLNQKNMLVSVPYRGATFLNTPSFFVITPLKARFPSPIGELHFSIIRTAVKFDCNVFMFPSPIGELHFSIFFRQIFWARKLCFRPLSGSYISQSPESAESTRLFPVSVPYRGATFLN